MTRLIPGFLLALLTACGDDQIEQGRTDLGLPAADAGEGEALYFQPGMRFSFCATLTFRDGLGNESSAQYAIEYLIETVEDQGAASALTAKATGERRFDQNWNGAAGADSWLARIGPSETTDRVGTQAVRFALGDAPASPPVRKNLPYNSMFFLDLRQSAAIRADWADTHPGLNAGSVDPSQHPLGHLALTLNGRDEELAFYPDEVKLRELSLGYDMNGVLAEAVERLGDSNQLNQPNGYFVLRQGACS